MKEIGLVEAKSNLSEIADEVRKLGQGVTLTKDGQPYVDLVPHRFPARSKRSKSDILADLDQLRRELPKSAFDDIKSDIEKGRR
jgi:antitoxin (DNA-binding transcriptional repressor) of toxin-antitoxin stability system